MSVLTDLSISYESLPGEPSFFVTSQQATPVAFETKQDALSLPYSSEVPKARSVMSNFDITPSFTTRHTIRRTASSHHPKVTTTQHNTVSKVSRTAETPKVVDTAVMQKPTPAPRRVVQESRGLFNEFERASLLSYMQRRQFS
jgi:hypothetical protein